MNKIKIFQIVRKNLAILGIDANYSRLNRKSAITWFSDALAITLSILFIIFKANTFLEYSMNIYITLTMSVIWISFMIMLYKKVKLFKLIDAMEAIVNGEY